MTSRVTIRPGAVTWSTAKPPLEPVSVVQRRVNGLQKGCPVTSYRISRATMLANAALNPAEGSAKLIAVTELPVVTVTE